MALHPQKVGYGISVAGHLAFVVAALIGFLSSPSKVDEGESVPVEIVSDEPAQSTRGDRRATEQTPTPQRVVDRQATEERRTEDDASLPTAPQRIQNVQLPPPPVPRPQPEPQPQQAEAPPPQPQQQAAAPPMPVPPQPQPRPMPPVAAEEVREDQAAREAELLAQQRREAEQRRQEEQRQAEQRRREEQRREEQRRVAEQREREQREARERQEREQRERQAREQRERQQREARERAERQRQERANARQFDPNSIASRLNMTSQENDRRQAARTEATGATAPTRTASLGTATGASSRITGREIDAIRAWAERCWEIPIAAREGNSPAVRLRVSFNPDGTVTARPEVQNPRGDSNFQVLANSAVRAVMRCSAEGGVRLPRERYDTWREVVLNFDPKEMMR